ncbi:MAG TPA: 6-carboxytetrahydropterin synthase QueD [Patescibacteria group bacterium]|nr:6-carboxytetrahydropterin synthase QueD [Patescibacteria group bacterium]
MYYLTITVEFEAAHRLPDYPGKCNRLHGHNWKVEVTIAGSRLNSLGMLMDFRELKAEVNTVVDRLDHYYLNELEAFATINPTAEHIAKYFYDELCNRTSFTDNAIRIDSVQVWESPKSAVLYRPSGL